MGALFRSCTDMLQLPSQIWKVWMSAVQRSQLLCAAAEELLQRRRRSCLSGWFRIWAAHAYNMQEARHVATAHGSIVAQRARRIQMQMGLAVSSWLRPEHSAYALSHTAAVHSSPAIQVIRGGDVHSWDLSSKDV
jgi:hypothetical protein